jgi:Eco57I restriction-modification methylase
MNLNRFKEINLFNAGTSFFKQLKVPLNSNTTTPLHLKDILKDKFKSQEIFEKVSAAYFLGLVDKSVFDDNLSLLEDKKISYEQADKKIHADYEGMMIFAVRIEGIASPTRTQLSDLTRAFNRASQSLPVVVLFQYGNFITLATSERTNYKQVWREGEKIGKISLLKDIDTLNPHTGHIKILDDLERKRDVRDFSGLYQQWRDVFNVQILNAQFYKDLSAWYYYAVSKIKLPKIPDAYAGRANPEEENIKQFVIRLIARLIFCWFLKEKEQLIAPELLALYDHQGNPRYFIIKEDEKTFLKENSYYGGILQNIFFNCLNRPMNYPKGRLKKSEEAKYDPTGRTKAEKKLDYCCKHYLKKNFDYDLFNSIPFLNGGLFDKIEGDNLWDRIDDKNISIPNELFYGRNLSIGAGRNTIVAEGINRILSRYKFTIAENTPLEEEVALDPELLGLIFENLLAEVNTDDQAASKSAKKASGSYYTPRKVIDYMVNESLLLYLKNYFKVHGFDNKGKKINDLVYLDKVDSSDSKFCTTIVNALDDIKILDPACGSGAFPMGMLNRIVQFLLLVDPDNNLWLSKYIKKLPPELQETTRKELVRHDLNYVRKLGIIRNAIYGIDIQPMASHITKLRFFISLLIDQKVDKSKPDNNYNIISFPNIETKIICADSLKNASTQLDWTDVNLFEKLKKSKEKYYQPQIASKLEEKDKIAEEIAEMLSALYSNFAEEITGRKAPDPKSEKERNKHIFKEWFMHGSVSAPFFNIDLFFPELEGVGFDIVLGNPPYGGAKISNDLKNALGIESKDPYGAFISRFIGDGTHKRPTPLKRSGILALIVSDTFMTIKSHKPLRRQIMKNYIHKMIRVHPDTFKATVNTAIIIIQRNIFPKNTPPDKYNIDPNHHCLMADLTTVSIHEKHDRFLELLYRTIDAEAVEDIEKDSNKLPVLKMHGDNWTSESSEEYAIYTYPQNLINTNSNLPFFVASPKLFAFMNDNNDQTNRVKTKKKDINGKQVQARYIPINGKEIPVVKLGEIADVKQGLATGDNKAYLFQNPQARGNYRSIEEFKEFLLTESDLEKILNNEKLRLAVIDKGISKNNEKSARYFDGRYIVPYDKGGASDAEGGWMPNYYVPTDYFIDWSEWAIIRMKTYTIAQRIRDNNENKRILPHYETQKAAVFRNTDTYFLEGITFSSRGVYSPTFRLKNNILYDKESSSIYSQRINELILILNSRMTRYLFKNDIQHTISSDVDSLKEIDIFVSNLNKLNISQCTQIIKKQKQNPRYDYASHEQIEIDRLVYEAYGLNEDDIQEVENWYVRRYPKLAAAQKANLEAKQKAESK